MIDSSLVYTLKKSNHNTIQGMIDYIEYIFEYEIPFLTKIQLARQKVDLREKILKFNRVPDILTITIEDWGSGVITLENEENVTY